MYLLPGLNGKNYQPTGPAVTTSTRIATGNNQLLFHTIALYAFHHIFSILIQLMSLLAFVRFKKVEKQIEENTYQRSSMIDLLLTISVLAVGVFIVMYLIQCT